jgi:hypothetical protein
VFHLWDCPKGVPNTSYLASYSDVNREKIGERVVNNDEQIVDLFHVVQESERGTCGSNST